MTRNIFVARAARVAVTIGLAALIATPGVAGGSTHFYSFFSTPSTGSLGTGLGSNGISDPFGGLGHGINLDFGTPHLNFGTGGGAGSNGLSSWSHQISGGGSTPFSAFSDSLRASSTFSLAVHTGTPGDAGLTTYQNALRNGTPSAWLSTYYSNNGGSGLGSIVGKDRTNPIRRAGCPPVPEVNTSVSFGLMLILGLIAWRFSVRPMTRRAVRIS